MEMLLIAWCVWAGLILFLCPLIKRGPESSRMRSQQTAQAGLDYIRISIALLSEWEMHQSNLLIIDLRSDTTKGANGDSIPGSLNIPIVQLAHLLRWIPPASRVVFYNEGEVDRFSTTVEQTLLTAGIDGVYTLDGGIGSWHTHKSHKGTSMRVGSPSSGF
jgi:rhodanese-related sulfurtransferase